MSNRRAVAQLLPNVILGFVIGGVVAGCAMSTDRPPIEPTFDSRSLIYDSLVLEFLEPSAIQQEVAVTSRDEAAGDGWKMLRQAPVGCVQTGFFYAYCLLAAPLFPALAAKNVQDPKVSLSQLSAIAAHIESIDYPRSYQTAVEQYAERAGLPVVEADSDPSAGRIARLLVRIEALQLHHEGYKKSSISLIQPYSFQLVDADGRVMNALQDRRFMRVEVDEWQASDAGELTATLSRWVDEIASKGMRETVLEWRPKLVLAPVSPQPVSKRNIIGVMQEFWPVVERTGAELAWQSLQDALEPEVFAEVTDVSYELEISGPNLSGYSIKGLERPEHVVMRELDACARYRWKPLARFRYKGVQHTTSLRTRYWGDGIVLDDHYVLNTEIRGCEE